MSTSLRYAPTERTSGIIVAMQRALTDVADNAEWFGHLIGTMRDGKVVQVTPQEFRIMVGLPSKSR